jgi:hypothetical protein
MESEERKQFVRSHRTCIFGCNRKNDGPSMVGFACEPVRL